MVIRNRNLFACYFSSSSVKILLFLVPLVLFSWAVSVSVPRFPGGTLSPAVSGTLPSSLDSLINSTTSNYYDRKAAATSHADDQYDRGSAAPPVSKVVVADVRGVGGGRAQEALSDESAVNRSASPPLSVRAVQVKQSGGNGGDGDGLTVSSTARSPNETPMMASPLNPNLTTVRVLTNLDRLEAGLASARASIKDARTLDQLPDPEYAPIGPMYWDAKVFHRSYLEMEKQFKIYVYRDGEPPVFHDGPCKSIYSMEGNFIHKLDMDSRFRTEDPEKAHAFFLPFSVARMVQYVYVHDSHDFSPIRRTVLDYVNLVARKYTYWNRSYGADHFMLACHDWGPEASLSLPNLYKNSIRALCNANTSERFDPVKDVSIPEINLQTEKLKGIVGGPSPSGRTVLAFFAGGVHGPIRPVLLEHWEDKDEDIKVHKYLPKGINYYGMMRSSKFCICPSGYEVASPRIVEALYNGCIPVLISKSYVPPFSDVLNWKSFSVTVSVEDIPNLKTILTGISTRQYIRMYRRVLQVRRHFVFNSPPQRFDVFHMILHSIWLRRLNVKISSDGGREL